MTRLGILPGERKSKGSKTVSENARLDAHSSVDDDLELWDQSGFMLRNDVDDPLTGAKWGGQGWCRPSCIPITVILILIVLVVLLPLLDAADKHALNSTDSNNKLGITCMDSCSISLTESIPLGMAYNVSSTHLSTFDSWMQLIAAARNTVEIASFYWTMNRQDVYPDESAKEGEEVFRALLEAGRDRGISLRIAQNAPSHLSPNVDTEYLAKKAKAQVQSLNFAGLLGGGVLHTKFWLIDRTHVYVGSANMDWRSLTQVKELGLVAFNCSCLATDLAKIFDVYWKLGEDGKVPSSWPESLGTKINMDNPMNLTLEDNKYRSFIASSPPPFSPEGRTNDLDAILHCIEKAEQFIYISVMDYYPLAIYTPKVKYWPMIDNALRAAAIERKVNVRLLISWWKHSRSSEDYFLKSLVDLSNSYRDVTIEVKRFVVPTSPEFDKIPFSRVNHNKYMVTDIHSYIGTSNWSGDYFLNTAGIGMVFEDVGSKNQDGIRQQLEGIFHRDWDSSYAHPLNASCLHDGRSRPSRTSHPLLMHVHRVLV
ncbi:phospholipase D3 isoform X2 [Orussus abietinus]|uniref:phospholipase D3 isoform X2 n=1 Tax=Orussus abietinus TaxID=222816 RepID=UPI00062673E5|nr:phospholipase D3 isoform X2 [Orussus abietinus]